MTLHSPPPTPLLLPFLADIREGQTTYMSLLPIALGCWINSGGEPLFHTLGFVLALVATAGRALKSVVQSILLTDPADKMDPMSLLLYMSMISTAILLPGTKIMEPEVRRQLNYFYF